MAVLIETQSAQELSDEQCSRTSGQAFAKTKAIRQPEIKPGWQRVAPSRKAAVCNFRR
jgi:hypothetical protein